MRFSTSILVGALVAVVSAQSSSSTTVDTPTSTWSLTPEQSSVAACYSACDQTDVGCLAKCNPVPNPSDDQANKTVECVGQCSQGNGTETDIANYTTCRDKCISDFYYNDKNGGTPNSASNGGSKTTASGSSQTSGSSSATGTGASASASGSSTATASGSQSSETGAAATLFGSSVALLGAVAAALAL
uniref:Extracellular membrane protein CFEM domain-containing protein n=1 Tax=Bionectria ochroleuca TaxID=29856 RepID=A0A8H7N9Y5_BIOOC